jgi:hypothetical protein
MIRRIHDLPAGPSVLVTALLVTAVAAHAGAWYFISQHWRLSGVLALTLIVIAVVKHLGWIGATFALLRRRRAPLEKRP